MIVKDLRENYADYLILFTAGVLFLVLLKVFQGDKTGSFLTTMIFIFFYIGWAINHHRAQKILHFKNMVEYVLIGLTVLALVVVMFLLK